jgi:hypothetical protein
MRALPLIERVLLVVMAIVIVLVLAFLWVEGGRASRAHAGGRR